MEDFSSKLLCRFQCQQSALFSSMYATDRHREAVVTLKMHHSFGSPRRGPFVDPSPLFGFRPIFWETLGYINEPNVVLSCSDNYFLLVVQSRGDNQLYLGFRKSTFCADCGVGQIYAILLRRRV